MNILHKKLDSTSIVALIMAIWFAFATSEEARNGALAAAGVFILATVLVHRRIDRASKPAPDWK